MRGVREKDGYAEIVGERVEAGAKKEESSHSTEKEKKKREHNAVPTVHRGVVKYLKAMLFYIT